jgi:hypothetical protein
LNFVNGSKVFEADYDPRAVRGEKLFANGESALQTTFGLWKLAQVPLAEAEPVEGGRDS